MCGSPDGVEQERAHGRWRECDMWGPCPETCSHGVTDNPVPSGRVPSLL